METESLAPCPFCASPLDTILIAAQVVAVECLGCGVHMRTRTGGAEIIAAVSRRTFPREAKLDDLDDALARLRHALCAAEEALRLARIERTAERADIVEYFYCADCAVEVYADEDGCCATCGADCEIRPGTGPHDTEGKR